MRGIRLSSWKLSVPTRFGKSLVYQLLLFCAESLLHNRASPRHSPLVVVILPLLSLMYNQVAKLVAKGVKAVCISGEKPSDMFADAIEGRVTHVARGGTPDLASGDRRHSDRFCRLVSNLVGLITADVGGSLCSLRRIFLLDYSKHSFCLESLRMLRRYGKHKNTEHRLGTAPATELRR